MRQIEEDGKGPENREARADDRYRDQKECVVVLPDDRRPQHDSEKSYRDRHLVTAGTTDHEGHEAECQADRHRHSACVVRG